MRRKNGNIKLRCCLGILLVLSLGLGSFRGSVLSASEDKKITISKNSVFLSEGDSVQLKVKGVKKKKVKWSSKNKGIATVTQSGRVKARKIGSAQIIAKAGGRTLTCLVTVEKQTFLTYKNDIFTEKIYGQIQYISSSLGEITSKAGIAAVYSLLAGSGLTDITAEKKIFMGSYDMTLHLEDGTNYYVSFLREDGEVRLWFKLSMYVVEDSQFLVKMLQAFDKYAIGTSSQETEMDTLESRYVTVKKPELSRTSVYLTKGETVKLRVKNTKKKIKWSSKNNKIAVVNRSGRVTAKKEGKTKIQAKLGKKILRCTVTVEKQMTIVYKNDIFTEERFRQIQYITSSISTNGNYTKKIKSKAGIAAVYALLAGMELTDITDTVAEDETMIGGVDVDIHFKNGTSAGATIGFQIRVSGGRLYSQRDSSLPDKLGKAIRKYKID